MLSKLSTPVLILFSCATISALGAEPARGSSEGVRGCAAPVESAGPPAPPAVDVPDCSASADADDIGALEAEVAARTQWTQYRAAVAERLSRSSDPRDWAFAFIAEQWRSDMSAARRDRASALLARALKAAPDDVLVQWIGSRAEQDRDVSVALGASARLKYVEPENAAVFLIDLDRASRNKDEAAVGKTLATMAASTRFDLHFAEMLKGMSAAFAKQPRPVFVSDNDTDAPVAPEAFPFADAMNSVSGLALPKFQHLVNACRVRSTEVSARAADCAAIGRLLVRSDTLIGNRTGYTVLRISHTYTAEDESSARQDDWVVGSSLKLLRGESSAAQNLAYHQTWLESGNELEAMRRHLAANGIAATPADYWSDDASPFSAQRLEQDEAWPEKFPPAE